MSWEPGKPSQNENEYFARRDAEWLREQRALLDAKRAQHPAGIKCARDGTELDEQVHDGVRIDVCPTCHGIWLDAGEVVQLLHLAPAALQHLVASVGSAPGQR
jgi:uncharacterized ferredoxin-like protein